MGSLLGLGVCGIRGYFCVLICASRRPVKEELINLR